MYHNLNYFLRNYSLINTLKLNLYFTKIKKNIYNLLGGL